MKQINLKDWIQIGAGGNGKTYRPADGSDDKVLLKVNKGKGSKFECVKEEFELSCAVAAMGLPTPKMYEVVKVGESYGTLFERVKNKKSICRICADDPSRIEEMAALMSRMVQELHSVECTSDCFRPVKEYAMKGLEFVRGYVKEPEYNTLKGWIDTMEDTRTCLHGDLNLGNLIVNPDGAWWIDLGRFTYGDPMVDIGHLYMFTHGETSAFSWSIQLGLQRLFHMKMRDLHRFWDAFVQAQGVTDKPAYEETVRRYVVIDELIGIGLQPSSLGARVIRLSVSRGNIPICKLRD